MGSHYDDTDYCPGCGNPGNCAGVRVCPGPPKPSRLDAVKWDKLNKRKIANSFSDATLSDLLKRIL